MASTGRVLLRAVFDMLNECAPGHQITQTDHYIRVRWSGKVYPSLPRGEHGKREARAEIQIPHVRKMVRILGIQDCAHRFLEALR